VWTSVRAYAGWVLVAAGALAILAGYLGVSREALVAKQLPYLVSGGIFGLALIALGTFYLYSEDLRRDSGRLDRLERMIAELHAVLLARPDAPDADEIASAVGRLEAEYAGATRSNGRPPPGRRRAAVLVALPDSHRYHRADCRMVEGKRGASEVTPVEISSRQLQPCGMCDPVVAIEV
jgi:hypothetical protein